MSALDLIFVPGWNGSGPTHWQTLWQEDLQGSRVVQRDWSQPEVREWVAALDARIEASISPVVLIAHSLGALTALHWAFSHPRPLAGAFFVTPPDPDTSDLDAVRRFQLPMVRPLGFPAVFVGSENDPYGSLDSTRRLAARAGCGFWNAGLAGHINVASGHGPWPEGREALAQFLETLPLRSSPTVQPEVHA